jgi:hypothetical protein
MLCETCGGLRAPTELPQDQGFREIGVAEIMRARIRVPPSGLDGAIVVSERALPRPHDDVAKTYERPDVIRLDSQGHAIVTGCLSIYSITLGASQTSTAIFRSSPEFINIPAIRPEIRGGGKANEKIVQQVDGPTVISL